MSGQVIRIFSSASRRSHLDEGDFFPALECSVSVAGMTQHARQLEFAEESDPGARDLLANTGKNLKRLYAELEEPPVGDDPSWPN